MGEKDSLWILINGWSFQYTKGDGFVGDKGQLLQPSGEPFFELEESGYNINLMFNILMNDAQEKIVDELVRRKDLGQDVDERTAFLVVDLDIVPYMKIKIANLGIIIFLILMLLLM